jgi:hypothetical protein
VGIYWKLYGGLEVKVGAWINNPFSDLSGGDDWDFERTLFEDCRMTLIAES